MMRVLITQQVAPFIIFCAPRCCPFRADERQRQAAMVAVVQVDFSRRRVHRVHLVFHLLHGQAARCQPAAAFLTHPVSQDFTFQPVEHLHRAGGNPPLCIGNSRYERFSLSIAEVIISLSSNLYNIVSKTGSRTIYIAKPAHGFTPFWQLNLFRNAGIGGNSLFPDCRGWTTTPCGGVRPLWYYGTSSRQVRSRYHGQSPGTSHQYPAVPAASRAHPVPRQ